MLFCVKLLYCINSKSIGYPNLHLHSINTILVSVIRSIDTSDRVKDGTKEPYTSCMGKGMINGIQLRNTSVNAFALRGISNETATTAFVSELSKYFRVMNTAR